MNMKKISFASVFVSLCMLPTSCRTTSSSHFDEEKPELFWSVSQEKTDNTSFLLKVYSGDLSKGVWFELERTDHNGQLFLKSGELGFEEFSELRRLISKSALGRLQGNFRPEAEVNAQKSKVVGDIWLIATMIECSPLPDCATRFEGVYRLSPVNPAVAELERFAEAFVERHPGGKAVFVDTLKGTPTVQ